jgi:predicted ATPase
MGTHISLGALEDLQCKKPQNKLLKVEIDQATLIVDCEKHSRTDYSVVIEDESNIVNDLFGMNFIYISADRYGPKNSSDIKFTRDNFDVGIYGEFAFAEFDRLIDTPISNIDLAKMITSDDKDKFTVGEVLKASMQRICPDFQIATQKVPEMDKVTTKYSSSMGENIRPTNVGFGFSCMFPIVLAGVCLEKGSTLVVENPEVHLHPKAQSFLAQFLTQVSASGVQVIIETHSDHIINGIRVFTKHNPSFAGKGIINSISKDDKKGQPKVTTIKLDKHGRFDSIEEGFFDQIQNDLMELF